MKEVSAIIVNYYSRDKTIACVESLLRSVWFDLKLEIIVVDNATFDGVASITERYPQIKFIQSEKNLGMGGGNNLGIKAASSTDYILILNADTELKPGSLKSIVDYMDTHPEAGLLGPKLVYVDGNLQQSYFRFPNLYMPLVRRTFLGRFGKKYLDNFLMKDFNNQSPGEVDWIMGSCLLIRKSVLDKIGYFDERFFMYFEDTDLCRRVKKAGWKNIYFPGAEVVHCHTRASAQDHWYVAIFKNRMARVHIKSALKYFWKWKVGNKR